VDGLETLLAAARRFCGALPDTRTGANRQYPRAEIGLAAFAVFFTQSPSFLAHQRHLSRFRQGGQRMLGVIPSRGLFREEHHGGPISCSGERRAAVRPHRSEPLAGPGRGGPGAGDPADSGGLDEPADRRSLRVREDTVRLWRSAFMQGGVAALHRSVAPGPVPVKAECALAIAEEVLSSPVADRFNWTLPRLADEIATRTGVRISASRLSVVLRQKGIFAGGGRATP
jgi:transposase